MSQKNDNNNKVQRLFALSITGMSIQLVIAILLPLMIGMGLDNHFKSKPLYALIGLLIGISLAVVVVYRTYQALTKNTLLDNKLEEKK